MDHKKAIAILIDMLKKRSLDAEEKEAVLTRFPWGGRLLSGRLSARRRSHPLRACSERESRQAKVEASRPSPHVVSEVEPWLVGAASASVP